MDDDDVCDFCGEECTIFGETRDGHQLCKYCYEESEVCQTLDIDRILRS